jgi:hypothetical protein
LVYLIGWASAFYVLLIQALAPYNGRALVLVLILYYLFLAVLRGSVGVDTYVYEAIYSKLLQQYEWDGLEPGFILVSWVLTKITPSVEIAVRCFSISFFFLIFLFVIKSNKNERFLLVSYYFPAFVYDYSMNTLRIGLASAVLLYSMIYLRNGSGKRFWLIGVMAALFHYSAICVSIYIFLTQRAFEKRHVLMGLPLVFLFLIALWQFSGGYFIEKYFAYSEMKSPSAYSGLSIIISILILVLGVSFDKLPTLEKAKLVLMATVSVCLAWLITQYTYAGIRILDLLSLCIPLSILASYSRLGLRFGNLMKTSLVLSGLISALGVFRNFLNSSGLGESPFLPYTLLLDVWG